MVILEKIKVDLAAAQKSVDARLVGILRLLMSALNYKKIEDQVENLVEEVEIGVLRGELKKRNEAIEIYEKARDLIRKGQEEFELKVIEGYLPALMAEEEVEKIARQIAAETGKAGGQLIGEVMRRLKGKVDGKVVARLVEKIYG